MGSWGLGIKQDDLVCDVIGLLDEYLKDGASIEGATQSVLDQFAESLEDIDESPLVWIAIAEAQWTYGELDKKVLLQVKDDLAKDRGLEVWRETSESVYRKRHQVLVRFIERISTPNTKPKKRPKRVVRAPKFGTGDCLAVKLSNGQYGAAIVLVADHSNQEYGKNLIAVLDYISMDPPSLKVFKKRRWLKLTHHNWDGRLDCSWYLPIGFRNEKDRFEIVGNTKLNRRDPKESTYYASWKTLGEGIIHQREWDTSAR
jgi:hypothetical protein